ncbi:Uncharacterised protein [Streptococcus pneumoniae]|uniref:Uncharacterized protein n=1 Tax=Streptococcus pneumoniae TaxID=1313 RepID=A0A4K3C339_STREE|nr:Uncharacterised protein [Streptococcus pneumoniae]CEY80001.1 Uncharacterised protein [Streptococcus pneumoniae]CEZ12701.1 Uncharacterised protein [Streptococcus pneumoniae]CFA06981.1 Uncharacterised protein [Streptococcus pneumoniae]CFV08751.1 Uncharacterised protein [Streptococcus pneumoniae]
MDILENSIQQFDSKVKYVSLFAESIFYQIP